MRVTPALSSSFHTLRSTRSTPSCNVLESICAGSMCAKRDRSSSASAKRATSSACARCHTSARSLVVRFRKFSKSAASRRWRSFQTSTSDLSGCGADAAGPLELPGESCAGAGSPVSGSSEGARGGESGDCGEWAWRLLFMSLEASVRQQDTPGLLRWVALLRTIRSDETGERFSHRRHREQVVRQLRVPLYRRMGRQSVSQAASRLDICHRISSAEYEQHRSLDAL